MKHDCSGPECHPYPTFDDDPARWGLLLEPDPEAFTSLDDWPIPYTLTPEGEAAASAEDPWADPDYHPRFAPPLTPEAAAAMADEAYGRPPGTSLRLLRGVLSPDPEIAFEEAVMVLDEWDSDDSAAYADRVEAGLEPEAEAEP